jgi:dTDP-glucose 4,6-dehydratase
MDFKGKKVLVTGAGGFIASHLVESLIQRRAKVTAFIRKTSMANIGMLNELPLEQLKKVNLTFGDLRNPELIKKVISDEGIEVVYHLGAMISIPDSYNASRDYVETNIGGTLNILEACKGGIEKILITSTSEVYGTALYTPIDEGHPLNPQSPYAASKVGADKLAESFYKSFGLPISIVRPFNTFGPRQSQRAVIPAVIIQALTQEKIRLGSLFTQRDFNYVQDTVNGFSKVGEYGKFEGEVTNICSGRTISIEDLVKRVGEIIKKDTLSMVEADESRLRPEKSEVQLLLGDYSKAEREVGWKPQFSFEEGLEKTINYIQQNIKKYNPERYAK